ncbi:MAG: hypothetical protein ABF743_10970 [Schleiferilactobacillus perolens]|uniref:hypothetical protein n=1 Tax=Schleiferilactobacillus perolens TaxID=100468 RepID=UPI0039E8699A
MKYYRVTVWRSIDNDQGQFVKVDAGIEDSELPKLIRAKPRMVKLLVNDGELMWIRADNVLDFTELFQTGHSADI